jgi:hypothetical protein
MNKVFLLPVAALFVVACAEPTAPSANFEIAMAKGGPAPLPTVSSETFETGTASLSNWSSSLLSTSLGSSKMAATGYLGRFGNENVSLSVPAGLSTVTISFDLYIIGTWDGAGQQGYGSDRWQIAVSRDGGDPVNVFHTSFSNQATKPQNFPKEIDLGTSPNDKGAAAVNALGYPKASGKFDVGDAIYHLTYKVSNPSRGALVFYFRTTTELQDLSDESWGLDNVVISGS